MRSYFAVPIFPGTAFLGSIVSPVIGKVPTSPLVIGLAVSKVSACLEIFDQPHETFILMVLMVAMKQRWTRVVGDEIDFRSRESNHVERVFHQPRCRLVADLGHLEGMPVQVDGVRVAAVVFHDEAVSLAPLDPRIAGLYQAMTCRFFQRL